MSRPRRTVTTDHQRLRDYDTYITPRCKQHGLSVQQARVLVRAAHGMTSKMIGEDMWITENTVKTHLAKASITLKAHDRTHAVHIAWTLGLFVRDPSGQPAIQLDRHISEYSGRVSPADYLAEALLRLDDATHNRGRFTDTPGFLRKAQRVLADAHRPLRVCLDCGSTTDTSERRAA